MYGFKIRCKQLYVCFFVLLLFCYHFIAIHQTLLVYKVYCSLVDSRGTKVF